MAHKSGLYGGEVRSIMTMEGVEVVSLGVGSAASSSRMSERGAADSIEVELANNVVGSKEGVGSG